RALFAAGKFDRYKRNIPYATLAQAFQSLVRQILSKSDAVVKEWRRVLLEALGPNGQLITSLIPALARRVRAAGASAGVVSRRSAMARRGDARPARASGHAPRGAPPPAGRRL